MKTLFVYRLDSESQWSHTLFQHLQRQPSFVIHQKITHIRCIVWSSLNPYKRGCIRGEPFFLLVFSQDDVLLPPLEPKGTLCQRRRSYGLMVESCSALLEEALDLGPAGLPHRLTLATFALTLCRWQFSGAAAHITCNNVILMYKIDLWQCGFSKTGNRMDKALSNTVTTLAVIKIGAHLLR